MNANHRPGRLNAANLLSGFRLVVAAPLMLLCAALGAREPFVWILSAAFLSDAIDGTVARLTGNLTRFGALLDSWADFAAYVAIAVGVGVLWPDKVRAELAAFVAIVTSFTVPSALGLLKFRRFTSYHTLLVKLAVAATAAGLLALLWNGPAWPFRLAAVIAVAAALEEIAITAVLDAPRANVKGFFAVLRARRHR